MIALNEPDGATPLGPDEKAGLKFSHVTTREELNELEHANIMNGLAWLESLARLSTNDILSLEFVEVLHQQLFGDVWQWAGSYRLRELNIGCDPIQITTQLHNLLEDTKCWIEFNHFSALELSARFQHQLVKIHPFPNGNGRHSRIMTDCIRTMLLNQPPLIWSAGDLDKQSEERSEYIASLREADKNDYQAFITYLESKGN